MSFRVPFSRESEWKTGRVVVIVLFCLHAGWIITHLSLVSRDLITPWKLGGYGMYTTVHPRPTVQVYDMRFDGMLIPPSQVRLENFVIENWRLAFRCLHVTEAAIRIFLSDNRHLQGVPLQLAILENRLMRNPIRPEWAPRTVLGIKWINQTDIVYAARTCGTDYRGKIDGAIAEVD
jgi:hypothetical protein